MIGYAHKYIQNMNPLIYLIIFLLYFFTIHKLASLKKNKKRRLQGAFIRKGIVLLVRHDQMVQQLYV